MLELHHLKYPFFSVWYSIMPLALLFLAFDYRFGYLVAFLFVCPDLISPLKTLCRRCHENETRRNGQGGEK